LAWYGAKHLKSLNEKSGMTSEDTYPDKSCRASKSKTLYLQAVKDLSPLVPLDRVLSGRSVQRDALIPMRRNIRPKALYGGLERMFTADEDQI